jgi:hypothetical protein
VVPSSHDDIASIPSAAWPAGGSQRVAVCVALALALARPWARIPQSSHYRQPCE